jgi:ribosome biogenesis GTPase A
MKKTRELIAANLKMVDLAIEVCDARIPVSSRNPIIDEILGEKDRILILNKSDLADENATARWLETLRNEKSKAGKRPLAVMALNSQSGAGVKTLFTRLEKIEKDKLPPSQTANRRRKPLRLMIVGVPNSGKSSLINRLTGKKSAQTGDRPGVTKGKQWLTLENGMQLLDTPGILWPKFEDPNVGQNLAFCGAIRDEILDTPELALSLLRVLIAGYPEQLAARYDIDLTPAETPDDPDELYDADGAPIEKDLALTVMDRIAEKRGYILPGKRIDYERTARQLLDEFRAAKIGRITLE